MDYLLVIFSGLLQGLTEFLPISSSGHLVLFHDLLGFNFFDNLTFDVVLHLGTAGALLLYFWPDVLKYARGFFQFFIKPNWKNDFDQRFGLYLIIGTIPAALAGYFFENQIENIFRQPFIVAILMIGFGILLWLADKYSKKIREISSINWFDATVIGLLQSLALVPGVSRSGITIIAGLARNLKRESAAKFSFLLSIPAVCGAGLKKLSEIESLSSQNFLLMLVGFVSAAIFGYLVIKYFLKYLQNHSLAVFVYYRIILGIIILFIIYFKK